MHHSQNTMSQMNIRKEDVLEYHASAPAGKISVTPTKPCATQRDLSLAYTPESRFRVSKSRNSRIWRTNTRPREIWSQW